MNKLKIGKWTYHPESLVVRYREDTPYEYELHLKDCRTYAHTLHSIFHVKEKSWATDQVIDDLIRILDVLLHPQATLGFSGEEKGPLPGGDKLRALIAENIKQWRQTMRRRRKIAETPLSNANQPHE